jgi:hypothetical protein
MGQNITNTSVSEYEEFQMEEIVPNINVSFLAGNKRIGNL